MTTNQVTFPFRQESVWDTNPVAYVLKYYVNLIKRIARNTYR